MLTTSRRPSVSLHGEPYALPLPSLTQKLATVLQDPSVAASPVENRVAFLKAKNLTEEEVHAALSRAGPEQGPAPAYAAPPPPPGAVAGQQPAYYGGYPPYGWQQPPPAVPKRDWRDWFIMATVVGGVSYGLYALGKVWRCSVVSMAISRTDSLTALRLPSCSATDTGTPRIRQEVDRRTV